MAKLDHQPQELTSTKSDTRVHGTPKTVPFVAEKPHREEEEAAPAQTKRPIRWMHWLAGIVLLAVVAGLVVFAVGNDGSETATLDPSYATAEQNRALTLSEIGVSGVLDPSYATAEQNRALTLSQFGVWNELDPSYAEAEQNRFLTLSE